MRQIKFRAKYKDKTYEVATREPKHKDAKGWHKSQGYVKRLVTEHPFVDSRGYVMEHRLVLEEKMGEFLPKKVVVHHIDNNRENNEETNLKVLNDQKSHAKIHIGERNDNGRFVAEQPIFTEIKFRLLNKNTGLSRIYTFQELIATTYRRGQFEFRGRWTGLLDKNGKEIYEGDLVRAIPNGLEPRKIQEVKWYEQNCCFGIDGYMQITKMQTDELTIIGNIWENENLLEKK